MHSNDFIDLVRTIKTSVSKILPEGNCGAVHLDTNRGSGIIAIHIPVKWDTMMEDEAIADTILEQVGGAIQESSVCRAILLQKTEAEVQHLKEKAELEKYKHHFDLEYKMKYGQEP